jgi:hypothetical protein
MMLGGVGFQAGLDEAARKQALARATPTPAADTEVVTQLKDLKVLLDDGVLTPGEFEVAKRKVLGG